MHHHDRSQSSKNVNIYEKVDEAVVARHSRKNSRVVRINSFWRLICTGDISQLKKRIWLKQQTNEDKNSRQQLSNDRASPHPQTKLNKTSQPVDYMNYISAKEWGQTEKMNSIRNVSKQKFQCIGKRKIHKSDFGIYSAIIQADSHEARSRKTSEVRYLDQNHSKRRK